MVNKDEKVELSHWRKWNRKYDHHISEVFQHYLVYFMAIWFAGSNLAWFGILFSAVLNTAFNGLAYYWLVIQALNVSVGFGLTAYMFMEIRKLPSPAWKEKLNKKK